MQTVSSSLVEEIVEALKTVGPYGSIEIYIQNSVVTQITMRNIKKTNVELPDDKQKPNGEFSGAGLKKQA